MWPNHRHANALLERAFEHLESPRSELLAMAAGRWWSGFAVGGPWMRRALVERLAPIVVREGEDSGLKWTLLGVFKYGQCALAALSLCALAVTFGQWWLLLLVIPLFYLVEAQWVFLFVLVAQGRPAPLRLSIRLTRQAGGSWRVMWTVLPLAWTMLTGWLKPQGALKSWCAGCLAVVIWYLELTDTQPLKHPGAIR